MSYHMKRKIGIVLLAALLMMTMVFSGCSIEDAMQKAQNKAIEMALEATVNTMVNVALEQYKQASPAVDCLLERVDMQVISSENGAEGIMATCKVSAPDVTEAIEKANPEDYVNQDGTINEEKLINDVIAAIKAAPITQQTVTIGLESTADGYVPKDIEAFVNAYTGGALNLLMKLYGEYIPQ